MMTQTHSTPHALFDDVCRYIEANVDESLPLATLAKLANLSPAHFQRQFKAVVGVSPKQYQTACRLKRFKHQLKSGETITDATYDAGFGSSSRVYETLDSNLGMKPTHYQRGGAGLTISYAFGDLSIGRILIGATDRGLCFLQIDTPGMDLLQTLKHEFPHARLEPMPEEQTLLLEHWMMALEAYLSNTPASNRSIPLDIQGTAFQRKVWLYLHTIPRGQVCSYAEVAHAIGQPKAARAVASACAANNIALLVPCHRVIRGDGQLSGYRWGVELKRSLLANEQKDAP